MFQISKLPVEDSKAWKLKDFKFEGLKVWKFGKIWKFEILKIRKDTEMVDFQYF